MQHIFKVRGVCEIHSGVEIRELPTCKVGNFTIVFNTFHKNGDKSTILRMVAFNKVAEVLKKHTKKGDNIYLEAEPQNTKYTTKSGDEITTVNFRVTEFSFIPSENKENKNLHDGYEKLTHHN